MPRIREKLLPSGGAAVWGAQLYPSSSLALTLREDLQAGAQRKSQRTSEVPLENKEYQALGLPRASSPQWDLQV